MIVVADTTPLNYLILIGEIDLLATMYGQVVIPQAVSEELRHSRTPAVVQDWIRKAPTWLEVRTPAGQGDAFLARLGAGERDAILLAEELPCDQLILDEALGRRMAEERGLPVIGTVGILREAADQGLLDLEDAFARLQQTSFHVSPVILAALLKR